MIKQSPAVHDTSFTQSPFDGEVSRPVPPKSDLRSRFSTGSAKRTWGSVFDPSAAQQNMSPAPSTVAVVDELRRKSAGPIQSLSMEEIRMFFINKVLYVEKQRIKQFKANNSKR